MPERTAPTITGEPRVHPDRSVDPKAAELRAETNPLKSIGRRHLLHRRGASRFELRYALWDTIAGMVFSEVVAYFIILATGATLFVAGKHDVASAT